MKNNPFTCRKSTQKIQMWTFWCIINITGLRLTWGASGLYTKIQNVKKKKKIKTTVIGEAVVEIGWMAGLVDLASFTHSSNQLFLKFFRLCVPCLRRAPETVETSEPVWLLPSDLSLMKWRKGPMKFAPPRWKEISSWTDCHRHASLSCWHHVSAYESCWGFFLFKVYPHIQQ